MSSIKNHIGFVSTRLAGTDGVSLEAEKWVSVLEKMGYMCYCFAGETDWSISRSYIVPEAHFNHPEVTKLQIDLFDDFIRSSETSGKVHTLRFYLKEHLYKFIEKFSIDLLIIENAIAIPMNVPLGLALTELMAETCIPAIGHHHDFTWERERFLVNAASDYLRGAFPPVLPYLRHVVINSAAGRRLARYTGASSTLLPNVMDFENPPAEPDGYADDLRSELGIPEKAFFILQPTRVVPRKRIEKSIELIHKMNCDCVLVVTHAAGDEGMSYRNYLQEYASVMGVQLLFAGDRFRYERGRDQDGRKLYSLRDAYQQADLVTYPSTIEGFGNAFLEALYYKKPIVMGQYEIYRIDIQPKGFKVIGIGNVIEDETVKYTSHLLYNSKLCKKIVGHNYALGLRYYSFEVLKHNLKVLINECLGLN